MTDRARGWMLVGAQFVLLGVLLLAPTGDLWAGSLVGDISRVGRVVAVAVIVLGAARLGLAASVHPEPTQKAALRTDGLYGFVRHPIYAGVLLLGVALALAGRSVVHLIAWAALLAVLHLKARFEERLLSDRFEDYGAYAARTPRFLPHLRGR